MADITPQESNFTAQVISTTGVILDIKPSVDELLGAWFGDQFGTTIDPVGLAAAFPGLTKQELTDAITGLIAVQTAIGDFQSGPAANFVKLRNITRSST